MTKQERQQKIALEFQIPAEAKHHRFQQLQDRTQHHSDQVAVQRLLVPSMNIGDANDRTLI
ncbi:hypothetical protein Csa_016882 [Cucumis sativus]|uniref:Uncharacterized protein n=1 Tax=Cucumis sativus TaxID=3659 RepID=A0A0A0K6V5_CUCSA|nr:hypothetical protein Csa_016882 [Cucumis sativus]